MENNEITISEARRVTAELKASILKLDALNQEVLNNIQLLEKSNITLNSYMSILSKFNFKDETEMTANYATYLAFLSKKIDELSKNKNLKRLENIVSNSNNIINFSITKLDATIAVCVGAFYILMKLN
ncbi:hypothetical protein [Aliarcobacter butzleri]|uniref:hypothetical protein n=1 Tax=Aliarcobacter butzleri TaxID=28197 RepID=UPI003450F23F